MIAMMNPEHSWVARYQKQQSYHPGVYAIQVSGVTGSNNEQYDEDDDDD